MSDFNMDDGRGPPSVVSARAHHENLREKDAAIAAMRRELQSLRAYFEDVLVDCESPGSRQTLEIQIAGIDRATSLDGASALLAELERLRGENKKLRTDVARSTGAARQCAEERDVFAADAERLRGERDEAKAALEKVQENVRAAVAKDGLLLLGWLRKNFPEYDLPHLVTAGDIILSVKSERDGLKGARDAAWRDRDRLTAEARELFERSTALADTAAALRSRVKTLEGALRQVEGNRRFEYLGEEIQGVVRAALSTAPVETR